MENITHSFVCVCGICTLGDTHESLEITRAYQVAEVWWERMAN